MARIQVRIPATAAELVSGLARPARIVGDAGRPISCVAPLEELCAGALGFSKQPFDAIESGIAMPVSAVVIVPLEGPEDRESADGAGLTLIKVSAPRAYFIRSVHYLIGPERLQATGGGSGAFVASDARVESDTYIGPGVVVGSRSAIGRRCILHGGVHIYEDVTLGDDAIVQANAVIGCHGQAYVRDDDGTILGLPHFGRVVVGARARIGANTTVVRGTLRDTEIGADSSIGNNVNIGHNVRVGARCFVGAGAVLAGSSSVGDDSWISPGVVVRGVAIGRGATVGAGAIVTRPIPDGKTANGFPARVTAADT